MKNLTLITIFILSAFVAKSKSVNVAIQDTTIYRQVDVPPAYPGGFTTLMDYLKKNQKPADDKGRVIVEFVVETDGRTSNIKVIRSVSETATKETTRLVSGFPRWKPGIKDGKAVRCYFTMPISFPTL